MALIGLIIGIVGALSLGAGFWLLVNQNGIGIPFVEAGIIFIIVGIVVSFFEGKSS